jgi:hypothetical protein
MNVTLWIAASVLAAAFLAAGLMKATQPKAKLADTMGWVEDFSGGTVRLIGLVEILGAVGLILPAAVGVAPVLTPLAAAGLAVAMVLAAIVHLRRGETAETAPALVLLVLTAVLAILRFGPYSF